MLFWRSTVPTALPGIELVFAGEKLPPRELSTGSVDPKDETEADMISPELGLLLLMKPKPEPPCAACAAVVEAPDVVVDKHPICPGKSDPLLGLFSAVPVPVAD